MADTNDKAVLEKALEELADKLTKANEKAIQEAKDAGESAAKKVSDETKAEIKSLVEQLKASQKQLDEMNVNMQKVVDFSGSVKPKSWETDFTEKLTKDEKFKHFVLSKTPKQVYNFDIAGGTIFKSAADMINTSNFSGQVTVPTVRPGIVYAPIRPNHVRELLNVYPCNSDTVYYFYESAINDGTKVSAQGADMGQSDFTITQTSKTVTRIGTYVRLAEEMLDDLAGLSAYLSVRFEGKLKVKEDQQLLYGTGQNNQLSGITTNAKAFDGTVSIGTTTINRQDILRSAIYQGRVNEYRPNYILLHPLDVMKIQYEKSSTYEYLNPSFFMGGMPNVGGVPIVETTAVTAGDFIVGDFNLGCSLWDRKQAVIEFSRDDYTNFTKGFYTARIWERLALTCENANAFIYGAFASALACGSA